MHFTDQSIVLSAKRHSENAAVVRALTREHGLYAGVVRGVSGKANRGLWQSGNLVLLTWKARLAEHMGMLSGEMIAPVAAHVLDSASRLAALSSACSLAEMCLPERHPYPALYEVLRHFALALKEDADWQEPYCRFELELLASAGFRLDLTHCAATGVTENLLYVSPKSGRAVSENAAEPYKDKLLPLPVFLLPGGPRPAKSSEILDSLRLTGYFLGAWLLESHGKKIPAARARLVSRLQETVEKKDKETPGDEQQRTHRIPA